MSLHKDFHTLPGFSIHDIHYWPHSGSPGVLELYSTLAKHSRRWYPSEMCGWWAWLWCLISQCCHLWPCMCISWFFFPYASIISICLRLVLAEAELRVISSFESLHPSTLPSELCRQKVWTRAGYSSILLGEREGSNHACKTNHWEWGINV